MTQGKTAPSGLLQLQLRLQLLDLELQPALDNLRHGFALKGLDLLVELMDLLLQLQPLLLAHVLEQRLARRLILVVAILARQSTSRTRFGHCTMVCAIGIGNNLNVDLFRFFLLENFLIGTYSIFRLLYIFFVQN